MALNIVIVEHQPALWLTVAMHSAFATLQFGPFETRYHRHAVNDEFRRAFSAYLERELLPQVEEPFDVTEGTLRAAYKREKFCGPRSAIKDAYAFKFSFLRQGSSDDIEMHLYQDLRAGTFQPRFKNERLFLWTRQRKERERLFISGIHDMAAAIARGERREWFCSCCNHHLTLEEETEVCRLNCSCGHSDRENDAAPIGNWCNLACPRGCISYVFFRNAREKTAAKGIFLSRPFTELSAA
jgi:hypothetical protein